MKLSARMILVLTSVGLISGSLLAVVNLLTRDRIAFNQQQEINAAILKVVPGTESSAELYAEESLTIYGGRDAEGQLIGYAVYTSGTGFQDVVSMMFGVDAEISRINSLTVLEQKETPGLGAKITDEQAFLRFWKNRAADRPLTLHKPAAGAPEELSPSEVNTITGATISSQKVMGIVNLSLERLKQLQQEGKLTGEGTDAE
jgi:RnfABCDGE-type electron transport complex G subunit